MRFLRKILTRKKAQEGEVKFMKKVVALCLLASIVYAAIAIIYQIITGQELSPTLTECFLRGVVTELAATAIIKVSEGWIEPFRIKHLSDNSLENYSNDVPQEYLTDEDITFTGREGE